MTRRQRLCVRDGSSSRSFTRHCSSLRASVPGGRRFFAPRQDLSAGLASPPPATVRDPEYQGHGKKKSTGDLHGYTYPSSLALVPTGSRGGSNNSKTLRNDHGSVSKKSGQAVVQGRHGANCSCLAWASSLLGRNLSLLTLLSSYFSETSGGSMLAEHSRFWILNQTHYLNESKLPLRV